MSSSSQAMKFDLKNLAVGLILGITITFSIAAKQQDGGTDGRFQMVTAGDSSTYYVIDTRTGEVWYNKLGAKLE